MTRCAYDAGGARLAMNHASNEGLFGLRFRLGVLVVLLTLAWSPACVGAITPFASTTVASHPRGIPSGWYNDFLAPTCSLYRGGSAPPLSKTTPPTPLPHTAFPLDQFDFDERRENLDSKICQRRFYNVSGRTVYFHETLGRLKGIPLSYKEHKTLWQIKYGIVLSYGSVSFASSLIPLFSDTESLFFLFFLFALVPYLLTLTKTNPLNFYSFKSLLCPMCVRLFGYNRLYKSKSPFRWCNEFRKAKVVDPTHFWISEKHANAFPQAASCFDVFEFVETPDLPPRGGDIFTFRCEGWPAGLSPEFRKKQHAHNVRVRFDAVKRVRGVQCYTNVRLAYFDGDYLLGQAAGAAVEVRRLHLVEKLFHCFSNPSFGGLVGEICSTGWFSTTFVAHCPRFLDFCHVLFSGAPIPRLLVASRTPGSKFVVGVPFWCSEV